MGVFNCMRIVLLISLCLSVIPASVKNFGENREAIQEANTPSHRTEEPPGSLMESIFDQNTQPLGGQQNRELSGLLKRQIELEYQLAAEQDYLQEFESFRDVYKVQAM